MSDGLEETSIPCDIQTLSYSDGQEQYPCAFLLKQKICVCGGEWSVNYGGGEDSGNPALLENQKRAFVTILVASSELDLLSLLSSKQASVNSNWLHKAVSHYLPCCPLLFGSLLFLLRLCEAMKACLPPRENFVHLASRGWPSGFTYLHYAKKHCVHSAFLFTDPRVKGQYLEYCCKGVTDHKWPQSCPCLLRQHTVYKKWWFEKQSLLSIVNYKQWLSLTIDLSIGIIDFTLSPLTPWGFLYIILHVSPTLTLGMKIVNSACMWMTLLASPSSYGTS